MVPGCLALTLALTGERGRTETAKATRRHPQLDAEKVWSLELKAAELDSLLFPAPVGREFAVHGINCTAFSDAYLVSSMGQKTVFG